MELRGSVLNVVDFGAFVDVGLPDAGLVHVSQLSSGFVRNPYEVVAVGDQVRVWVASIDKDRRRVALTMLPPGTERERPSRERKPRRKPAVAAAAVAAEAGAPAQAPRERRPPRRDQKHGRREDRGRRQPVRTGAYEKRATKKQVPITKAMEEGKEYMRTFGDLLQFHRKKQEPDAKSDAPPANGSAPSSGGPTEPTSG